MKLLITGAHGQVGSELVAQATHIGHDVYAYGSKELDITHLDQVSECFAKVQPDVVINAAAYTAVDKAETEQSLAYAVNESGSEHLALLCKQYDCPLLHISTDYVFDGEKTSDYLETDSPHAIGAYGASKLAGDEKIKAIWSKHIIVRVSWVFGQQGNNFVKTMLRLAQQKDELGIVDDQYGAPTSARAIAQCLLAILATPRFKQEDEPWGTYHLQSDPGVTWFEFAQEIFKQAYSLGVIDKQMKLNPISSAEFPTPVKRPANSKLAGGKLEQLFGLSPAQWQADLTTMLTHLAKT